MNTFAMNKAHSIEAALKTTAEALLEVMSYTRGSATSESRRLWQTSNQLRKVLVLGITSVIGHEDRDGFTHSLSNLGLGWTIVQNQLFNTYYQLMAGIPCSFTNNETTRKIRSNTRWVAHETYAEENHEEGPYNGSYIGARVTDMPYHHVHHVPYNPTPLLFHGPCPRDSPFSYFPSPPRPVAEPEPEALGHIRHTPAARIRSLNLLTTVPLTTPSLILLDKRIYVS